MGTEKFPLWQYYKDALEWFKQEPLPRQHSEPPAAHYRGRIQGDLLTPYREMYVIVLLNVLLIYTQSIGNSTVLFNRLA
jgi:hypothetical protein